MEGFLRNYYIGLATCENFAIYDRSWSKFLSYDNIQ